MELSNLDITVYSRICFDIFNTIIIRDCPDSFIKREWAKRICERYDLKISVTDFYNSRIKEERVTSITEVIGFKSKQCNINSVLNVLFKEYLVDKTTVEEFIAVSEEIELDIELEHDTIDSNWLHWLIQEKAVPVLCISDYYYGEKYLIKLLERLGVPTKKIKQIYVSCDYGKTKRDGTLYKLVSELEKCNAELMIMIGDNYNSDYVQAKKKGYKTYFINNRKKLWKYCKPENYQKYIKANFNFDTFQATVFLFYEFIDKLYHQLKRDGYNKVLFFAREGELLQKLFNIYKEINGFSDIKSEYFCVSRQATYLPSLKSYKDVELERFFNAEGKIQLANLLEDLNIENKKDWKTIFKSNYITIDEYFGSKDLKEAINQEIINQKELFNNYVQQLGVKNDSKIAFVDIGYLGKAQSHIFYILDEKYDIDGYYMFLMKSKQYISDSNRKHGLLYDEYCGDKQNYYCMNKGMLEDILSASHGSTKRYIEKNGIVSPVFHNVAIEEDVFGKIILPIQKNIISNFRLLAKTYHSLGMNSVDYSSFHKKMYAKFIMNPSLEEMETYLKIPHVQNYGIHTVEYPKQREKGNMFTSIKNIGNIFFSKGEIIREQNARWLPAAFYVLRVEEINQMLYMFRRLVIEISNLDFKRRNKDL